MSTKEIEVGGSLNELFEMLSHGHRRRVLVAVGRQNPQDDEDIASESVAERDERGDDEALDSVQQQLYHAHLPKLAEAGFIDWNRDSGVITRGPRFEEIEPLLRLMSDHEDELPDGWP
ncbi:DUF7344 domain-containing protein [Natronomonas marina]|jgi:hypothetical protein|uniref:DUF7344 domain-containing protein n=1 Tax=Natronomonas marina TaxID=2961939 RepID=UPI0020C9408A|nr:ArsR family transcriptional regulator [Natronomonas marina]